MVGLIDLNIKMKKIIFAFLILVSVACDKAIVEPKNTAYLPVSLDEKAGTWKTYLIKKPDEFVLNKPLPIDNKDYKLESLALLKSMDSLTAKDKENIAYWSAGATLRWNEIARELIAKYNVEVKVDADGNYPIANPLLPNEYPKYPNANPQYAARVFAYLSIAQYDALVSVWHYKYKFNRPNPYVANTDIKPILEKTDLPSFPSEDAALAAVSFKVLSKMFPGEIEFLAKKAQDAVTYRMKAGMNLSSDLFMGGKLGEYVADKMLEYEGRDGMADANKQSILPEQKKAAAALGIIKQWETQISPAKPAHLPNFGNVKTWNFDLKVLKSLRPIPSILPESTAWQTEVDVLKTIGKGASKDQLKLIETWDDGNNTYSLAGHWFKIASDEAVKAKLGDMRISRAYALLGGAILDAFIGSWDAKYYYHLPRPQQYGVKANTIVPNAPGFTAEHATVGGAASTLLGGIFPYKSSEFAKMGRDASDSRLYAMTHFKEDCELGLTHGIKIGSYALIRAEKDNSGLTIATK
jgi:hypothetical protein